METSFNRILSEMKLDPSFIDLEITESVLMRDLLHAAYVLANLET